MEYPGRPPLGAEVCEEIEARQYSVQKRYSAKLRLFAEDVSELPPLARILSGNEAIHPPRQPIAFCKCLRAYAIELFDAEARAYPRNDSLPASLDILARRVEVKIIDHVLSIGASPLNAFRIGLTYHVSEQEMRETIRAALKNRINGPSAVSSATTRPLAKPTTALRNVTEAQPQRKPPAQRVPESKTRRQLLEPRPDLLTNPDATLSRLRAAEALGITSRTLDRWITDKKLTPFGAGLRKRFKAKDLQRLLNQKLLDKRDNK
jgi:hypothetical protein